MPLSFASAGQVYNIKKITAKPEVHQHLHDLGFIEGEAVSVISSFGGNVIVKIKESRIAIDKSMAAKILV